MIPRIYPLISMALLALAFASAAILYPQLPEHVPVHWNVHGVADGFGPRWMDTFLFPAIATALVALLILIPIFSRQRATLERFGRTYGRIMVTVTAALVAIHMVILLKAAGRPVAIDRVMVIVVGLLLAILGNWMGKVRRNSFVGIRTPWTLANDIVWERTHRIGGRVMVAHGLASVLAAIVAPGWPALVVLVGGALALVVWSMLYSWFLASRLRRGEAGN